MTWEGIFWYLLVMDCSIYAIMTFTASYHSKKAHHFWKGIPLYWGMALYYIALVAWVGNALARLNII